MIQARTVLWLMILAGITVHSIVLSNINIALPAMVRHKTADNSAADRRAAEMGKCAERNFFAAANANQTFSSSRNDSRMSMTDSEIFDKQEEELREKSRFDWPEYQQNMILSCHYIVFGLSQMYGGYLCHKYGAKKVWGASNFALGISIFFGPAAARLHYGALIALRMLQGVLAGLGIAGGPTQLIAKWVPPHDRGKYMTTFLGTPLGIALAYSMYGFVIHWSSWEYTFYISGAIALTWFALFYYLIFETPSDHPRISVDELKYIKSKLGTSLSDKKLPVPWKSILTSLPFLVNLACKFGVMWGIFTLSVFIPSYFSIVHGFPIYKAGILSGLPFILKVVFAMSFSTCTDYILYRDALTRTNTRKLAVLVSGVLGGILLFGVPLSGCNTSLVIIFLTTTMTLNGGIASGVIPNLIDLSPNYSGVMEGIAGFVTSFTGCLAPFAVSYIVRDNTIEQWNMVFIITGSMYLVPGLLFLCFADSEVQPWNQPKEKDPNECHMLNDTKIIDLTAAAGHT